MSGADINAADETTGKTALLLAISRGKIKILNWIEYNNVNSFYVKNSNDYANLKLIISINDTQDKWILRDYSLKMEPTLMLSTIWTIQFWS